MLQRRPDLSELFMCGTSYLFEPKAAFQVGTSGGPRLPEVAVALPLQKGVFLPMTKEVGRRKGSHVPWTPGH